MSTLTVPELAAEACRSKSIVRRRCSDGRLTSFKRAWRRHIRRDAACELFILRSRYYYRPVPKEIVEKIRRCDDLILE